MNEWFAGLEQRDRVFLIGASVVIALLVLYVFVLRPLNERTAFLAQEVSAKQSLRIDLARAAGIRANTARGPASTGSSLGIVSSTANQHAVALGMVRQDGQDGDLVRITFTDVPFDSLAAWLSTLSSEHSIRVEQINMNRRERGFVTGTATLRRS